MEKWSKIREKGKWRFIWQFGIVISIPLVIDYIIIKLLLNSFKMELSWLDFCIVWILSVLVCFLFGMFGWIRMESDFNP